MLRHGTFLVADVWWADWISAQGAASGWNAEQLRKNDETALAQRDAFAAAAKAGVRMAFGTDVGGFPFDLPGRQFATMVECGLTPMEAVQAATRNAAELIGWSDVGAISAGRHADLIAIEGTELDVAALADVSFVMKGGHVVKAA
jgi:imidazolonepropionase-like amidohydrolase